MKTATIPSLRVDPALRAAAEGVLEEGESLSSFVEQAIRLTVERRHSQREFIARALGSRDAAQRTGDYVGADTVMQGLQRRLERAKAKRTAGT